MHQCVILAQNCIMNAFSEFALLIYQQGKCLLYHLYQSAVLYPSLVCWRGRQRVSSGLSGSQQHEWSPSFVHPTQSINFPHCTPVHQNSPSPAHSRTPTPTPGSQTPQPHTPSLPQLATSGSQQQLPLSASSDNAMQPQQQPLGGTPPAVSHSGLSTPNASQHPRTPVSTPVWYATKILGPNL